MKIHSIQLSEAQELEAVLRVLVRERNATAASLARQDQTIKRQAARLAREEGHMVNPSLDRTIARFS